MSRSLFSERYWSLRDHGPFKSFALLPSFSTEALHLTYLLCLLPTELLFYCVTLLMRYFFKALPSRDSLSRSFLRSFLRSFSTLCGRHPDVLVGLGFILSVFNSI